MITRAWSVTPAGARISLERLAESNAVMRRAGAWTSRSLRSGVHTIVAGPAAGLRIDPAGSRPSYVLGTAEPEAIRYIAAHLRPGDAFLDLGANVGYFTLVGAALVGREGRVLSFEPAPANAAALRRNVELNRLDTVEVIEAAVSDRRGSASFDLGDDDQSGRLGSGTQTVRTVTVDDELARTGLTPALVKIDVEGAEEAAVRGMLATLRAHRPTLICEMHQHPDLRAPLPTALRDHGYELHWLEGEIDGTDFWAPHLIAEPAAAWELSSPVR